MCEKQGIFLLCIFVMKLINLTLRGYHAALEELPGKPGQLAKNILAGKYNDLPGDLLTGVLALMVKDSGAGAAVIDRSALTNSLGRELEAKGVRVLSAAKVWQRG